VSGYSNFCCKGIFISFKNIPHASLDYPPKALRLFRVKEVNLHQAYDLLQLSTAIVLEGRLIEPTLMGVQDDDSNEFMYVSWEEEFDDENLTVEISFFEGDNQVALIEGSTLTLINSDGEEEEFTLLREFDAESTIIPKN
jgi:hypothetical protein